MQNFLFFVLSVPIFAWAVPANCFFQKSPQTAASGFTGGNKEGFPGAESTGA